MAIDPVVLIGAAAAALGAIGAAILILRPLRIALEADREEGRPMRFRLTAAFLGIRFVHVAGSLHVPSLAALTTLSSISGEARVQGGLRRRLLEAAAPRVLRVTRWLLRRAGWRGLAEALLARRGDIRFGRLEGRIEYALEDPAITGELYGQVMAWLAWLAPGHHFELAPRWTFENAWSGRVRARVDVWGVRLVFLLVWQLAMTAWRAPARATADAAASLPG